MVSREPAARVVGLSRRRVLFVEDDAFGAALVQATLEDAGYDVHWSSSGRSAITAARRSGYDAYLLGLGARELSPGAMAEALARLDGGVPIVVIADDPRNLPSGVDLSLVRRPFAAGALLRALRAAVSGSCRQAA
jgi:DNA-binding response OmpR family regulator